MSIVDGGFHLNVAGKSSRSIIRPQTAVNRRTIQSDISSAVLAPVRRLLRAAEGK